MSPGLLGVHFEFGFAHQGAQDFKGSSVATISNISLDGARFAQGVGHKAARLKHMDRGCFKYLLLKEYLVETVVSARGVAPKWNQWIGWHVGNQFRR